MADQAQAAPAQPQARHGRAGRNLPVAIAVGAGLFGLILLTLWLEVRAFVALVTVVCCIGAWELTVGLRQAKVRTPRLPAIVCTAVTIPSAFIFGGQGLALSFGLSLIAIILWRAVGGVAHSTRDIAGATMVLAYAGLLAGFCALMVREDDGAQRVIVFIATVAASDIGGYAVGVLKGKHPMSPSISPKKSWEGFAGSVGACLLVGCLAVSLVLGGPWWGGLVLGVAVALSATIGDLSESVIKRDLGIKDFGSIFPGHGGAMDRLDSLLVCAPLTWAMLAWLAPPGGV